MLIIASTLMCGVLSFLLYVVFGSSFDEVDEIDGIQYIIGVLSIITFSLLLYDLTHVNVDQIGPSYPSYCTYILLICLVLIITLLIVLIYKMAEYGEIQVNRTKQAGLGGGNVGMPTSSTIIDGSMQSKFQSERTQVNETVAQNATRYAQLQAGDRPIS